MSAMCTAEASHILGGRTALLCQNTLHGRLQSSIHRSPGLRLQGRPPAGLGMDKKREGRGDKVDTYKGEGGEDSKILIQKQPTGSTGPWWPRIFINAHSCLSSRLCGYLTPQNRLASGWEVMSTRQEDTVETSTGDGNGALPPSVNDNGSGGGDNGGGGMEDESEPELLNLAEAEAIAAEKGVELPADFIAAAQGEGLRFQTLKKYIDLQGLLLIGFLMHTFSWARDRLIADPRFLFKILAEVSIDSGCCTVAEVRKRGHAFWGEFEFYLSDMLVGIFLDVVLVTLLAPVAIAGKRPKFMQYTGFKRWLGKLPSAVFEASIPGVREYTVVDRVACYLVKGVEYGGVGIACGFVGQSIANGCMMMKRMSGGISDSDVAIPPLIKTALVWGLFMGVSSNTRYQIVVGLERLVDMTVAKQVPQIAYVTTILIRFANNIIGGENFIDMARWAGVQ